MFAYGSAKTYFVNELRKAKYLLKHAELPKRVWQGHNTSVGREDLLVIKVTGLKTASEETCKPEQIQARTADLLLAFAVDNQMKNCASLYSTIFKPPKDLLDSAVSWRMHEIA